MSERRPLSRRVRFLIAVAVVLVGVGIVVTMRAVVRRREIRTRSRLESLQEWARAAWAHADKRSLTFPRVIRTFSDPARWNDPPSSVANDEAHGDVERDAWGKPIRLRVPGLVHFRGYDLWSCGPNGIDDNGEGDDILIGEDVETEAEYTKRAIGDVAARIRKATPIPATGDARDPTGLHALGRGLWANQGGRPIEFCCFRTREAVESYETNFFIGSVEPIEAGDAWDHLIRYRCPGPVHTKGWDLYSLGPNGVDDRGRGDDILVGEDAPAGR